MWMLKVDLETQYPQHEELALHDAVPEHPEVGVQVQGLTARVKVPAWENGNAYSRQGSGLTSSSSHTLSRHKLQSPSTIHEHRVTLLIFLKNHSS